MGKIRNYTAQEYYWQNLSKKARSQLYPIFNSPRNKDRQTYIQIIKITLDPFKSKTDWITEKAKETRRIKLRPCTRY